MTILVGAFGSIVGSFLNVVAYRVPLHRSIISPPSACPECGISLKRFDNIPVISWFLLRGKCRGCKSPISVRYPTVELGTGVLFGFVAWKLLPKTISKLSFTAFDASMLFELIAFLYLASMSVVLALIDLDTHTLPNRVVLPSYLVGVLLLGGAAATRGDYGSMLRAALGAGSLALLYLVLAFVHPGGMGFGDVKLAGVLGLFLGYLGWGALITGAFAGFVFGGLFGILLILLRKANRKSGIPFGPWMLLGTWVGVFFGAPISHGYLSLFGLTNGA